MSKKYLRVAERVESYLELEYKCTTLCENLQAWVSLEYKCTTLCENLQAWVSQYGEDVEIRQEYAGYDGGYDYELWAYRDETDIERNKRLEKSRKAREKKEETRVKKEQKEREQYEKLKAKYD